MELQVYLRIISTCNLCCSLFKSASECVWNSLKVVYFRRTRHGYDIESEECVQLSLYPNYKHLHRIDVEHGKDEKIGILL